MKNIHYSKHPKIIGKLITDETLKISELELKSNFKIMMVGSLESDIQSVNQRPDIDSVVNDFDDDNDEKDGPFESKQVSNI